MALERSKLADIAYIPNTTGSIYANPAGKKSYIRGFTIFNGLSGPITVRLYNVPDSSGSLGTAGGGNQFLSHNLAALETLFVEFPYPIVLTDTNDSIQASATTADVATIMLHGDVE